MTARKATEETKPAPSPRKVVWSGKMDPALLARGKAVAYWTPGMTFSHLVELALTAYLEEWEKTKGKPKPAPGPLRNGRPLTLKGLR
jgi:hypothetical protein